MLRTYLLTNIMYRPITPYSYLDLAVQLANFYKEDVRAWSADRKCDIADGYEMYFEYANGVDVKLYRVLDLLVDSYILHGANLGNLESRILNAGVECIGAFCKYFELDVDVDRLSTMYNDSLQYIQECRKSFNV